MRLELVYVFLVAMAFFFGFVGYVLHEKNKFSTAILTVVCWLLALACLGSCFKIFEQAKQERAERIHTVFSYFVQTPKEEWVSQDGKFRIVSVDGKTFVQFDSTILWSEVLEVEKLSDGGIMFRDTKNGEQKVAVSRDLEIVRF